MSDNGWWCSGSTAYHACSVACRSDGCTDRPCSMLLLLLLKPADGFSLLLLLHPAGNSNLAHQVSVMYSSQFLSTRRPTANLRIMYTHTHRFCRVHG
jgi:hypothetical protein